MPKVSQEYIDNKKSLIVEAAYELCLEKTVSTVTMQDIINRTGLSQGGIYRFYRDIDEIFSDMLMAMRSKISIKEKTDEIFSHADEFSPAEVTFQIFDMLAEFMTQELMGLGKIEFELSVLAMNSPDRIEKILAGAKGIGHKEYIMMRTAEHFTQKLTDGGIQTKVTPNELMTFIASAYSGIQMSCIVNNCYRKAPMAEAYQPKTLMKTLAISVNHLLGLS